MPFNFFRPKPGRFGTHPVPLVSGRINTGTLAAGTATHNIGSFPAKAFINRAVVCAEVFPTATDVTVQLIKVTGGTTKALTSALSINALTANVPVALVFDPALTEAEQTLTSASSLRLTMVTTGAVSVQPDDITVNVELLVEE